ncbi:AAA family ATPase [Salinarchaeum sp. IM2453]|uniref:ParA family protein n=1 Tax=Salinarchaeum sp. IM2453 TaxID=2862870 RepID=UPI001C8345EC|nr:AAA family ATPase [Salinarchaeum sp. IM2453]QZA89392.1 AAA family ATPase [Salinarchaeum sp. IM2453]
METAAFTGVVGGVGTTRVAIETAGVLAAQGHAAAVLDVNFSTQGLAGYVDAPLEADMMDALIDPSCTKEGICTIEKPVDGKLGVIPAFGPLSKIAEASKTEHAQQLDAVIEQMPPEYDFIIIDTPPVATNPSLAGITAADDIVAITQDTQRGIDGLRRMHERLSDIDVDVDKQIITFTDNSSFIDNPTAAIPELPPTDPNSVPVTIHGTHSSEFSSVAEAVFPSVSD